MATLPGKPTNTYLPRFVLLERTWTLTFRTQRLPRHHATPRCYLLTARTALQYAQRTFSAPRDGRPSCAGRRTDDGDAWPHAAWRFKINYWFRQ